MIQQTPLFKFCSDKSNQQINKKIGRIKKAVLVMKNGHYL